MLRKLISVQRSFQDADHERKPEDCTEEEEEEPEATTQDEEYDSYHTPVIEIHIRICIV